MSKETISTQRKRAILTQLQRRGIGSMAPRSRDPMARLLAAAEVLKTTAVTPRRMSKPAAAPLKRIATRRRSQQLASKGDTGVGAHADRKPSVVPPAQVAARAPGEHRLLRYHLLLADWLLSRVRLCMDRSLPEHAQPACPARTRLAWSLP
jgi:hypothetical protein